VLGENDLLAAEVGQGQVGDLEVGRGQRGGGRHLLSISSVVLAAAASSRWCFSCSQRSQSPAATYSGRRGVTSNHASTAARSSGSRRRRSAKPISPRPTSKRSCSSRRVRRRCSSAGPYRR